MRTCDRCCAESKVRWSKGSSRLDMCRHHSNQHGPELIAAGWAAQERLDPTGDRQPGRPLSRHGT